MAECSVMVLARTSCSELQNRPASPKPQERQVYDRDALYDGSAGRQEWPLKELPWVRCGRLVNRATNLKNESDECKFLNVTLARRAYNPSRKSGGAPAVSFSTQAPPKPGGPQRL